MKTDPKHPVANCNFCKVGKSGFKFCSGNCSEFNQAKEMEKEQQLELIQFLADREDFKEHSSMSIFIAEDFLNQFKNK